MTLSGIHRGVMLGMPFLISSGITGVVMGVTYREVGLSLPLSVAVSAIVFSGTAQAATAALWTASPVPFLAMAITVISINLRYVIMGAHLRHLFADLSPRKAVAGLFLLTDGSWAMTVKRVAHGDRDAGILLGTSLPIWIAWVAGTAAGHTLGIAPTGPAASAASFLPLGFMVALIPAQRGGRATWASWITTSITAAAALLVLPATWATLIGALTGIAVGARQSGEHDDG
jgi:predicted branched-subunit amino acid permease